MNAERIAARRANIAAARAKLEKRIADGHPNSEIYKERLAEYDKSERMLDLKAELAALESGDGGDELPESEAGSERAVNPD